MKKFVFLLVALLLGAGAASAQSNLLNDLKREFGYTYLFITHDLSVVKFLSDRILVMQQGRIVEQGNADELYAHPQMEYTKRLLAAIPRL